MALVKMKNVISLKNTIYFSLLRYYFACDFLFKIVCFCYNKIYFESTKLTLLTISRAAKSNYQKLYRCYPSFYSMYLFCKPKFTNN